MVLGVCDAIGVAVGVGLAPPAKLNSPMRVFQPALAYSLACQKVVLSVGSIVVML